MIRVKFYKTIQRKDRLVMTRYFETIEAAIEAVDKWEEQTPNNYAVYSGGSKDND